MATRDIDLALMVLATPEQYSYVINRTAELIQNLNKERRQNNEFLFLNRTFVREFRSATKRYMAEKKKSKLDARRMASNELAKKTDRQFATRVTNAVLYVRTGMHMRRAAGWKIRNLLALSQYKNYSRIHQWMVTVLRGESLSGFSDVAFMKYVSVDNAAEVLCFELAREHAAK